MTRQQEGLQPSQCSLRKTKETGSRWWVTDGFTYCVDYSSGWFLTYLIRQHQTSRQILESTIKQKQAVDKFPDWEIVLFDRNLHRAIYGTKTTLAGMDYSSRDQWERRTSDCMIHHSNERSFLYKQHKCSFLLVARMWANQWNIRRLIFVDGWAMFMKTDSFRR